MGRWKKPENFSFHSKLGFWKFLDPPHELRRTERDDVAILQGLQGQRYLSEWETAEGAGYAIC